jgi:hypothetical protein
MHPRNEREAHRAFVESCPPCSGDCRQGRDCPAENDGPRDSRPLLLVLLGLAVFWTLVGIGVVRCMS